MIAISACLAGKCCKYNGGSNEVESLRKLYESQEAILICPEVEGGLPVPRVPSEIVQDKVLTQDGKDVTENYRQGALKCLEKCKEAHCTMAVLRARSPSCGVGEVYDGTFSHTVVKKDGIFTQLARENGICCMTDEEYLQKL